MTKIDVLDRGFVELLGSYPSTNMDMAVVAAARTSYISESKGYVKDVQLLKYLWKNKHLSPFEQVSFQFRIKAPIVVFWQLVRHRTFKVNAQSGRYTEYDENEIFRPYIWRKQSTDNKQGSYGIFDYGMGNAIKDVFDKQVESSMKVYKDMLEVGVAKEQARLILPAFAMYQQWVVTADSRNLMNFFDQRLDPHAQWEIRQYANAMFDIFQEKMPLTAKLYQGEYLDEYE